MELITVTLRTDMRPWRKGDDIHVSPELAATLVEKGEAENARPFAKPNAPKVPARPQKAPERPILSLGRKARR